MIRLLVGSTLGVVTSLTTYGSINSDTLIANTQTVANAATCHTLQGAAAAYFADNDAVPLSVSDLMPYVSAPEAGLRPYMVTSGIVQGPGCTP
jgi:hypothetical protein